MREPRLWIDRSALLAGDLSPRGIRSQIRSGDLRRLRPGRYVPTAMWDDADEEEQHRVRALEMGDRLGGRAAICHESAAVLHGLQMPRVPMPTVHATWPGSTGRSRTTNVTPHRSQLTDADLVHIDGILVTSAARTVFDLARSSPWERAISAADSAVRQRSCTPSDLALVLAATERTPGAFRARRIIEFADGRAESVGESICRLRMAQLGLPTPTLQSVISDPGRDFRARVDFDFEAFRTVGEFDGKIKYGRLLAPGEKPGDAVFREKVREDRIRDTGRQFVRVIWADLAAPAVILERFRAAFRRAGFPDWEPLPPRFRASRIRA